MNRSRDRLLTLIVLVPCACFCSLSSAQQNVRPEAETTPQLPDYTLRVSTNRVIVDVAVKDVNGAPIRNLTKDDFVVEEDGKPQAIRSFDTFDLDKGMSYVPPQTVALPPNTFTNLPQSAERGPLYILLYDLVNTPITDQVPARAALFRFMQQKPAGIRFAIFVLSDGLHLIQGFTSDENLLTSAMDPREPKPHVPGIFTMAGNFGQGDKSTAISAIRSIAQFVAPLPGKKNLIWFSSEFPLSLFPRPDGNEDLQEEAKATLNLLAQHQIAVYPVDVSGVRIADEYAPPGPLPGSDPGVTPKPPPSGATVNHGYSLVSQSYITQDEIASITGGEAVYSSNDITGSLKRVTEDGGNYYSLTYSPSNQHFDGRLRHIEVKLRKGAGSLSYRHSYYGTNAADVGGGGNAEIAGIMKHGEPELHQLIFGMRAVQTSAPSGDAKKQLYILSYRVMAQQPAQEAALSAEFEIAAAAYDSDGRLVNSTVNLAKGVQADTRPSTRRSYRIEQELAVPTASKFLRVGVRDVLTGKMGAMEISLPLSSLN